MKVLAIESASIAASCAVSEDGSLLGEYTLNHKKTHSEKLMPLIEELLNELNIKIQDIDVIAISEGPGSYTGLRIGAAIAKSLAFAVDIPIANIPTTKSLAANVFDVSKLIVPVMDAKAGRIYTGVYRWNEGKISTVKEQYPCNIDDMLEMMNEYEEPIIFNGDGAVNYRDIIEKKLRQRAYFAPGRYNFLNASTLASIGYDMALMGEFVQASDFRPQYLRMSQAERNKK
ncbi:MULTISPECIES: tRNA (adenosine(37)-N6)-threonylcarbamoyltransferase complex dimerization subunit type 1 TsaB [unclassified Sedimentibacter]|uniref:tRNA (adenosine(37)-N6)-threonylcarbamoyltransferase complex dimerization subunit type 1 TsaB n=1 Tax=unclassified Sedimentibacter TaxID=2649220 RepID=UPI0027DEE32F|nr:tRNA (adenosine(37)-N6)-threonylcarbamoyltransferase complex dimerization subunit type 1 TsaB [Sedimentibacter sp. MB35-C1]WMJ76711.1 tRNA (adenosine(37)-N6)-threonylcarbamoyltransferase complex dimerization subunit type 1 TsaB [Sedimentibacter sp. MB35-C1]